MILDLVPHDDPILKTELELFNFANPFTDTQQLCRNLAETMIHNKGLGLSANQVGLKYRVFVINGDPIHAIFNPKIVDFSEEESYMEEGCLSYPGLFVKIKRPASVRMRFQIPTGETQTKVLTGLTARICQHEMDHLEGKNYLDRATKFHIEAAKKLQRKNK